jgi:hypothetical protein
MSQAICSVRKFQQRPRSKSPSIKFQPSQQLRRSIRGSTSRCLNHHSKSLNQPLRVSETKAKRVMKSQQRLEAFSKNSKPQIWVNLEVLETHFEISPATSSTHFKFLKPENSKSKPSHEIWKQRTHIEVPETTISRQQQIEAIQQQLEVSNGKICNFEETLATSRSIPAISRYLKSPSRSP